MSIVSSVLSKEGAQKDGRFWVLETHTDNAGVAYQIRYLASAGTLDAMLNATMSARATQTGDSLANEEVAENIGRILIDGSLATVTAVYATLAAIRAGLRAAYQSATRTDAIMLGDFLSSLTDPQLQTLFSMTAGQVTTLRSNKLTPAANVAATIRASTGA
jgi:hypothetical protein